MKVKGTAVKVLPEFIQKNYPDIYERWLDSLSPKSKEIFYNPIFSSEWYELKDAHTYPTIVLADILNRKAEDLAFEIGKYSAQQSLTGVYSVFLKIVSIKYSFNRLENIMRTYYSPIIFEGLEVEKNFVKFKFGYTTREENLLYYRNKGWITKFIDLARPNSVYEVDFELNLNQNDNYFAIFTVKW